MYERVVHDREEICGVISYIHILNILEANGVIISWLVSTHISEEVGELSPGGHFADEPGALDGLATDDSGCTQHFV